MNQPIKSSVGFYSSVLETIKKRQPGRLAEWDGHDYRIYCPMSLDDEAIIRVELIKKDGVRLIIVIAT